MTETKVARPRRAGCARQALWVILAFIVLLASFIALVLLSTLLPLTEDQRVILWVGGFLFLFLLIIVGTFIGSYRLGRRRATQLDQVFIPLGLSGKGYLWNGRQYHGLMNGRQVDIYFYRGPSVDIYVAASLNTRMGIGLKGSFSQLDSKIINRPELVVVDPQLAQLGFYPEDEAWGRGLLDDSQAKSIIQHLINPQSNVEFRNLLFQPEAIQLQIHNASLNELTSQNSRAWLNDLITLAGVAESIPTPTVTSVASPLERRARLQRSDFAMLLASLTCGIIGFFTAIAIIVVIVLINLGKGG